MQHLEGRFIPSKLEVEQDREIFGQVMQEGYRRRMLRRSRAYLQTLSPSDRRSLCTYFENEDDIRSLDQERQTIRRKLKQAGYDESAIQALNGLLERLNTERDEVAHETERGTLRQSDTLRLFSGDSDSITFDNDD